MTALIISNKEMEDIMTMVKSLEELGLLIKSVNETIKHEAKEQKVRFLGTLLDKLGASQLGNMSASKGVITAGQIFS